MKKRNNNNLSKSAPSKLMRQRGAVLVVSLLFMSVMSILGINAAKKNVIQERMANSYRFGVESLNHAESGLQDAIAAINAGQLWANGYSDELDPNGDGTFVDRWVLELTDPNTNIAYNVIMVDDDDGDGNPSVDSNNIVMLMAQGTSPSGSVRTVEVAIDTGSMGGGMLSLDKAILTGEDLEISGNPELCGSQQDIHSNENVVLSGDTITTGVVSASGSVSGTPQGGGTKKSGVPNVHIPDINPADFEEYVDYVFASNGRVYDSSGNQVGNADGNTWRGWKFGGDKWTVESDDSRDVQGGDLYFKGQYGNVNVGAEVGKSGGLWDVTILADGYIEISGNPHVSNYKDTDDPVGFQNILFMAGTDLKVNGNPDTSYQGILAAREQIDFSGNPEIHGAIIAQGASNNDDMAKDGNYMSGNAKICFDGMVSPWEDPNGEVNDAEILSWRSLTLAEDAGDFAATAENGQTQY